jgi:hypothetical protein
MYTYDRPTQTEPESEVQEEYSDPQASSCVSANIVCEKVKLRRIHYNPLVLFWITSLC